MGFELVVDIAQCTFVSYRRMLCESKTIVRVQSGGYIDMYVYICIHTGFDRNDLYDPITKYVLWM